MSDSEFLTMSLSLQACHSEPVTISLSFTGTDLQAGTERPGAKAGGELGGEGWQPCSRQERAGSHGQDRRGLAAMVKTTSPEAPDEVHRVRTG